MKFPMGLAAAAVLVLLPAAPTAAAGGRPHAPTRGTREYPGRHPIPPASVEPNRGQADPAVRYVARGLTCTALVADSATVLLTRDGGAIRMGIEGAAPPVYEAGNVLPGLHHHILGDDPARWVTGVPRLSSVLLRGAAPGVDLAWRGQGSEIAWEARLAPGTDPGALLFLFEGARAVDVGGRGELRLHLPRGVLRQSAPRAWQRAPGGRRPVGAAWEALPGGRARVALDRAAIDPRLAVHVDPRLEHSTYLGGSSNEEGRGAAVDPAGNAFTCGNTSSTDFPVTTGAWSTYISGQQDTFVSKFGPTGTLAWSTFLGGVGAELYQRIAVDGAGCAYVGCMTYSPDYPKKDPVQAVHGDGASPSSFDLGVTKLAADGASLAWSTYLGGKGYDAMGDVFVTPGGVAAVCGNTSATGFPVVNAFQSSLSQPANTDGFAAVFDVSGKSLACSTYLGGNVGFEALTGAAIDGNGVLHLAGYGNTQSFPLLNYLQLVNAGGNEGLYARIRISDGAYLMGTYLGGSGNDQINDLALDADGAAFLCGDSASPSGFPVTSGAYSTTMSGYSDAFVMKIAADGSAIEWSTFLGGTGSEQAHAIAVNSMGQPCVTGQVGSTDFPVTTGAIQSTRTGNTAVFLSRLAADGTALLYSTYYGGNETNGGEYSYGLGIDGTAAVICGYTWATTGLPLVNPLATSLKGNTDAFVARVVFTPAPPTGLRAYLTHITSIGVEWTPGPDPADGWILERRVGTGTWGTAAVLAPQEVYFHDTGLQYDTTYSYRIRAYSAEGSSLPTAPVTKTTPLALPQPPLAPTGLQVAIVSPERADLAWVDESYDENFFQVLRRTGSGLYEVLGTPGPGTTSFEDLTLQPDRSYEWKVRAFNGLGPSLDSNVAGGETPPTLSLTPVKGAIVRATKPSRDSLVLSAVLSPLPAAGDGTLDPVAEGLELLYGGREGTRLLLVAPGDPGWKLRKAGWTWKSPRGSPGKAIVSIQPETGAFKATFKRISLPADPATPLVFSVRTGTLAGTDGAAWENWKPGRWRFPPVPE